MLDLFMAAALAQALSPDPCQALPLPGAARNCRPWRAVGRDPVAELSVDPATLQRNGRSFDVVTRVVFAAPQEDGMRSGVVLSRYDCAARTWAIRHSAFYDAGGVLLAEADSSGDVAEAQLVLEGGPNAAVLDQYCEG